MTSSTTMLPVAQAETVIFELVQPLGIQDSETVDLVAAGGRILAIAVSSPLDVPHWDNSSMDGYAVRFVDVQFCQPEQPVTLTLVEAIPAGHLPQHPIAPGQASRILTGSMMPTGADTVVIQEQTRSHETGQIVILAAPSERGANVRHRGAFCQAGTALLSARIELQAPELAILAAVGCSKVQVYRRPRVAIFSTGDELVPPGQSLKPGQIVDSNQVALALLVAQSGAEPLMLGIVPDRPEQVSRAIVEAVATADVVLSTGGVSVGDYDYVEQMLASLGATIHVRSVAIKPGKPLTVATFDPEKGGAAEDQNAANASEPRSKLYFGLPGNPVSSLATFWRFVQPALRKLSGLAAGWEPTFVSAQVRQPLRSDGKRETYLWGRLVQGQAGYEFEVAGGSHSSGNLINLSQTNGFAVVPLGVETIAQGMSAQVLQVGQVMRSI